MMMTTRRHRRLIIILALICAVEFESYHSSWTSIGSTLLSWGIGTVAVPSSSTSTTTTLMSSFYQNFATNYNNYFAATTMTTTTTTTGARTNNNSSTNNNGTTTTTKSNNSDPNSPPRLHPHAGARYSDGSWGYVADATRVRSWMLRQYDAYQRQQEVHKQQQQKREQAAAIMATAAAPNSNNHTTNNNKNSTSTNATTARTRTADDPAVDRMSYVPFLNDEKFEEMTQICETKPGWGPEGSRGWQLLMERIIVDGPDPEPLVVVNDTTATTINFTTRTKNVDNSSSNHRSNSGNSSSTTTTSSSGWQKRAMEWVHSWFNTTTTTTSDNSGNKRKPFTGKILCAIYTHGPNHHRVQGITETWGWKCDGFFAASTNTTDHPSQLGYGAIDLPHRGKEEYGNMWQKTRSILSYMYDHYLQDFDYFYVAGDDAYVIVENLRNYLRLLEEEQHAESGGNTTAAAEVPMYLGSACPTKTPMYSFPGGDSFACGGAGYVLNRAALKRLVETTLPSCYPIMQTFKEDVYAAACLHRAGINLTDTADAQHRQRFQNFDPQLMATARAIVGFYKAIYEHWAYHQGHGFKRFKDIISTQTITFHLIKTPEAMKRIHAIIYKTCPRGTVLGDAIQKHYTAASNNNHG